MKDLKNYFNIFSFAGVIIYWWIILTSVILPLFPPTSASAVNVSYTASILTFPYSLLLLYGILPTIGPDYTVVGSWYLYLAFASFHSFGIYILIFLMQKGTKVLLIKSRQVNIKV